MSREARDFFVALGVSVGIAVMFAIFMAVAEGCFTPTQARVCVELAAARDAGADR